MANLTDQQIFEAAVYELSTTDPVMGGPGGVDNRPHQQLANRTVWLKAWIDQQIANGLVIPSDITAAINAHLAATDPHAQYTTNAEVLALITANAPAAPVQSVAGKKGNVVLTASDVGAEAANSNIQAHIGSKANPHNVTAAQLGAETLIPNRLTPQHGLVAANGKAVLLAQDTNLQIWSDTVDSGLYNLYISKPQNGLPTGWWYIEKMRHSSDIVSNQHCVLRATRLNTGSANGMWQCRCLNGVWSRWTASLDKVSDSAGVVHYKDLVHYFASLNISGTMKIVLPKSWSNTMLQIRIQGYDYSGGTQGRNWSVDVSGYNNTGSLWINYSANITGNAPFTSVRLAHDGTRCVILLGTTATVWQYPAVVVTDCVASYTNTAGWDTGWSISPITSEAGITNIATPVTNKQVMAGSMIIHAGAAIPLGYLKTNGAAISRTSYAQLFSVIGATYGAGNGTTTFNLPDTRGEFLRGWDDARGVDAGRARGSWQSDSFRSHAHLMTDVAGPILGRDGEIDASVHATINDRNYVARNTQATGGAETRPRNLAVQYLIKY